MFYLLRNGNLTLPNIKDDQDTEEKALNVYIYFIDSSISRRSFTVLMEVGFTVRGC